MWSSQHWNRCVVRKQWRCWDGRNAYSRCAADARRTTGCTSAHQRRSEFRRGGGGRQLFDEDRAKTTEHGGRHATTEADAFEAAPSTISREVNGKSGRRRYRACRADEAAYKRARRPKATKFRQYPRLRAQVESMLNARWSPQQISARLTVDYPDDPEMRVSHETIYRSLFVQSRGALRKELTACLRSGRTRRRPHGRKDPGGYIKEMVLIADRPAEIEDRAVPGHWEGDLMLGARGQSAIATLVERQTRYVMLLAVGRNKTSPHVCGLIAKKIRTLPQHLAVSLTWDRGKEMAGHRQFSIATGVHVYFCDPSSPWQRGTNENTNGLLRQYFPRRSDLSVHSQRHLNRVAHMLNDRPRQTLGWMKPSEKLAELLR